MKQRISLATGFVETKPKLTKKYLKKVKAHRWTAAQLAEVNKLRMSGIPYTEAINMVRRGLTTKP